VPSAFETCASATSFVRGESRAANASKSTSPVRVIGATLSVAPVCSHSICHGTMLAWCSSHDTRISSPGPNLGRPYDCATRLMASVVPRTKTISRVERALMKRRTFSRAPSNKSVASWLSVCTPRCTFACEVS